MTFTPEDLAKLESKQLANVIRKLNSGKTLTAREEALLARARATPAAGVQTPAPTPLGSGFAKNWDDLAQALGVSRKSVQNWRGRADLVGKFPTPRADGRHDVAAWARFMVEHQLARADEHVDPDEWESGGEKLRTVQDWKRRREELQCIRLERDMDKEDGRLLVATELEIPLGATFAAIQTKLSQFPARVARFLVGFRDEQEIEARLREEMDADLTDLQGAQFVNLTVGEIVAHLPFDDETEQLLRQVTFEGQDRVALLELIARVGLEALRRVGQRALAYARPDAATAAGSQPQSNVPNPESEPPRDRPASPAETSCRESTDTAPPTPSVPPESVPAGKACRSKLQASGGKKRSRKPRPKPAPAPADVEGAILTTRKRRSRR